jgi:hypothetical protein
VAANKSLTVDLGPADEAAIETTEKALGASLPGDYRAWVRARDGLEGWIAGAYIAFWPVSALQQLNAAIQTDRFAPGLLVFATNGAGVGYGFETRVSPWPVAEFPMIGMDWGLAETRASSFDNFLKALEATPGQPDHLDTSKLGLQIHEIKPVIVGGDPTDPANKKLLPMTDYLPLTLWWNERIAAVRKQGAH